MDKLKRHESILWLEEFVLSGFESQMDGSDKRIWLVLYAISASETGKLV